MTEHKKAPVHDKKHVNAHKPEAGHAQAAHAEGGAAAGAKKVLQGGLNLLNPIYMGKAIGKRVRAVLAGVAHIAFSPLRPLGLEPKGIVDSIRGIKKGVVTGVDSTLNFARKAGKTGVDVATEPVPSAAEGVKQIVWGAITGENVLPKAANESTEHGGHKTPGKKMPMLPNLRYNRTSAADSN